MKTRGLRVFDEGNDKILIPLHDILKLVDQHAYHWGILFVDGMPKKPYVEEISHVQNILEKSDQGIPISEENLMELSSKFFQIYEIVLIGSKNHLDLKKDYSEIILFQQHDIVIVMIDCAFWEIYSHDKSLLEKYEKKFLKTEWIDMETLKDLK